MVTGDHRAAAEAAAREVGIREVEAGILPEGKAEIVRKHQARGPVAMVGDGLNDAPALAQADLGIAIGSGTDVAMEAAGVTLLRADLRGVATAIRLARATLATIRWNLVWAFGYNAVMIPLAMAGRMSPHARGGGDGPLQRVRGAELPAAPALPLAWRRRPADDAAEPGSTLSAHNPGDEADAAAGVGWRRGPTSSSPRSSRASPGSSPRRSSAIVSPPSRPRRRSCASRRA